MSTGSRSAHFHDSDQARRQDLYREFIDEASASYIDALTSSTPDLAKQIHIYSLVSRMRVVSSPEVIGSARQIAQLIINSYSQPNKSFPDLLQMANDEQFLDPLCNFSEACRKELDGQ
jgi:hypothetical protein